jgi:serine/threonine protein kinase/tetratricopeptide (TPR) repeat protein
MLRDAAMGQNLSKEEAIFHAALEIAGADQRSAYLQAACAEEPDLRQRVEALLRRCSEAAGPLDRPAPRLAATAADPPIDRPGTVIGTYKLLEQIGEGGFGVVFMAEQQEPIRRKVALKVLKPGMDSKQVIARFEAERQALALMDHPNIAKVLDAGQTSSGRPYFIMDLVKGMPVTDYADQNNLPVRERLELFVAVCQAVQHAHQKGIIHRDIKPSNVLVTLHDGTPVVKVIDFGIAKALGQQLTDKTLHTGFAQLVGTPLYMSPEQAALSGLDVDTRSDIYSLGVVLYELLTGTTPFDKERLKDVGFDELRRIIREEEPAKPSTRISTLGQAASTVSANRQSDPKRLSRFLRGELDWIVMKCLEKDRNRRYDTANSLALDVERFLADEAVQACPPSAWYRFSKLARRHKAGLSAGLLAAGALVLTSAVLAISNVRISQEVELKEEALKLATEKEKLATEQADLARTREDEARKQERLAKKHADEAGRQQRRAERNLQRALNEKARADQNLASAEKAVDTYLNKTVGDPRLKAADLYEFRKELLATAIPFYEEFARQEGHDPLTKAKGGSAYHRLALVRAEMGDKQQALADLDQARAVFIRLVADSPAEFRYRVEVAQIYLDRGGVLRELGQHSAALDDFRQALVLAEALVHDFPGQPQSRHTLAMSRAHLGQVLQEFGKAADAEQAYRQAVAINKELAEEFPAVVQYRRNLANEHNSLGRLLAELGKPHQAEDPFRQAATLLEHVTKEAPHVAQDRQRLAGIYDNLGVVLGQLRKSTEGLASIRKALAIQEQLGNEFVAIPEYRRELAITQVNLAVLLRDLGERAEAEQALYRAKAHWEKLVAGFHAVPKYWLGLAKTDHNLGVVLGEQGKRAEAEKAYRRAITTLTKLAAKFPKDPAYRLELALNHCSLGSLLYSLARHPAEAEAAFRQALTLQRKLTDDHPHVPLYRHDLAGTHHGLAWSLLTCPDLKLRDPNRAVRLARTAVELVPNDETFWGGLGMAHYRAGDWKAAVAALDKCLRLGRGGDAGDRFFLAMAHHQLGNRDEARKHYDRAVAWLATNSQALAKNPQQTEELHCFRAEAAELLGIQQKEN